MMDLWPTLNRAAEITLNPEQPLIYDPTLMKPMVSSNENELIAIRDAFVYLKVAMSKLRDAQGFTEVETNRVQYHQLAMVCGQLMDALERKA